MYKYLALLMLVTNAFSQNLGFIDPQYDSLKSYNVFLETVNKGFYTEYKVNGKPVSREKYNNYNLQWNSIGACKPCYLYTFDENDRLQHVAFQYKDCIVGVYREYYSDGGIKVIGQFKENLTGEWDSLFQRNLCNVRIGRWQYFSQEGKLYLIEFYDEMGRLFQKQDIDMTVSNTQNNSNNNEGDTSLKESIKKIFKNEEEEK